MDPNRKGNPIKTIQRGKSYLMHLVSKSPKTEFQIRQKLKRADYSDELIGAIIEFGIKYQYIDDDSYVRLWLKSQVTIKQYGKFKSIQELRKKGISQNIIEEHVNSFFDQSDISEHQMALSYLSKKQHLIKGESKYQKKQKAYRILFQRGYTTDIINSALADHFDSNNKETENAYQKRLF